jgi:aminopeptidase
MENFLSELEKYAQLTITLGTNVQPGQTLFVRAPIESAQFVRMVVQKAYAAGAKHVYVEWSDDEVNKISYELEPMEGLNDFPDWKVRQMESLATAGAAFLTVYAPNPDLLGSIDAERIAAANKTRAAALEKFSDAMMSDKVSWCLVSVPTPGWANKVFPGIPEKEQMDKLWDAIFRATRIYAENPVTAWQKHVDNLKKRVDFLNRKNFKLLHYKAIGTDLTIALPEGHVWRGGGAETQGGTPFMPNIPTEEVFTLPLRSGVNGVVSSTKPLNYSGKYIENLSLRFENGKIVEAKADTELETLKKLIETDDGSHYLGEVALVPFDSPISNSNIIFANTLFDENASCHLAIGAAYPTCLTGGTEMSREELDKRGVNNSLMHVDFMIGSSDMCIDGELADGTRVPLFRDGNWTN